MYFHSHLQSQRADRPDLPPHKIPKLTRLLHYITVVTSTCTSRKSHNGSDSRRHYTQLSRVTASDVTLVPTPREVAGEHLKLGIDLHAFQDTYVTLAVVRPTRVQVAHKRTVGILELRLTHRQ